MHVKFILENEGLRKCYITIIKQWNFIFNRFLYLSTDIKIEVRRALLMDKEKLIECVQGQPPLYNHHLKDHHNNVITRKGWEAVGAAMNQPPDECKKAWKSVLTQFRKEKKNKDAPSGSGRTKKKEWPYYEMMSFMLPVIKNRSTSSNVGNLLSSEEDNSDDNGQESDRGGLAEQAASSGKKRKSSSSVADGIDRLTSALESRKEERRRGAEIKSPNQMFLLSLLPELEGLKPNYQMMAKMEMMNALQKIMKQQEVSNTMMNAGSGVSATPPSHRYASSTSSNEADWATKTYEDL